MQLLVEMKFANSLIKTNFTKEKNFKLFPYSHAIPQYTKVLSTIAHVQSMILNFIFSFLIIILLLLHILSIFLTSFHCYSDNTSKRGKMELNSITINISFSMSCMNYELMMIMRNSYIFSLQQLPAISFCGCKFRFCGKNFLRLFFLSFHAYVWALKLSDGTKSSVHCYYTQSSF